MKALFTFLFAAIIFVSSVQAATLTIHGVVFEKGIRKPIPDAMISVKEASASAMSDEQGRYSMILPENAEYTLTAVKFGEFIPTSTTVQWQKGRSSLSANFYLMPLFKLDEVVVVSERSPDRVSKTTISGKVLNKIAGTSGDPLAGIKALPGVVSSGRSGAPAVRGSGPGDNAYYVDSLPIGKVFHTVGISVFNADLISDFNLYSAAFSPRYRNVTGAVVDVALRNPRTDQLGGKLNINMLGVDALIEGPVSADQSFYFAARRSYVDLLIKQVEQNGITVQVPNYSDYQGKYIKRLNGTDRLTFHLQGASDSLSLHVGGSSDLAKKQPILAGNIALSNAYAMQAAVWDATLFDHAYNKLAFGHRLADATTSAASAGKLYLAQDDWMLREQMTLAFNEEHELALGANYTRVNFTVDANAKNATCTQFNPICDLTSAAQYQLSERFQSNGWEAFAQDRKRLTSDLTLVSGLRYSYEDYLYKSYTEPRIGIEWETSPKILITAGWGRHNQMPKAQRIAHVFGNSKLDHLRADHSVLGIQYKLDELWSLKAETYYKKFSNLVVDDPQLNYVNGASGSAYGLEMLVKKDDGERMSGWFSLSLSRSERRNDITGETFRFELDQPVNAKLVNSYKLNDDWTLDTTWTAHSGTPYTPISGTSGSYPDGRSIPNYAAINSGTLPFYHRLDMRLERQLLRNTYKLNLYFELNNIYQQENIVGYSYDSSYTSKKPVSSFVLPFSFGVQAEF